MGLKPTASKQAMASSVDRKSRNALAASGLALFFITGADAVASIVAWRESAAIADLATLIAVTRPGFALTEENILGGSLRLMFAFPAGLLLSRIFKPVHVRGAFWIGGIAVVAISSVPRLGGSEHLWMNGIYDAVCAIVLFPAIVWLAASGKTTDRITTRVCKFLGDISYPLYMVHYPFIYLYYAWVKNENLTFTESLPGAAALVVGSVLLAWGCLKLYDEPVRRFLSKRLLRAKNK